MGSPSKTYTYSPLGWAIWLYGPMFVLFGGVITYIWISSMIHGAANSSTQLHGAVDLITYVTHFGCIDRCEVIDYVFGGILVIGFPLFAALMIGIGTLMMNSNRTATVSTGSIAVFQGAFFHWGKHSLSSSDIADITIDSVPIIAVFGNRATVMGERWNVGAVLHANEGKKPKRVVIALCTSEQLAQQVQSEITTIFG